MDAEGLPVALSRTPGQAQGKAAVAGLLDAHPAIRGVVADRGYDARAILDLIAARGGHGHIPPTQPRPSAMRLYESASGGARANLRKG